MNPSKVIKFNNSEDFEQIDITEGYQNAYRKISQDNKVDISRKLREKLYPDGVEKITYSPQTESIYYYNTDQTESTHQLQWELFEDRGATVETKLISNLMEIDEIKQDFDTITKEEKQIDYMPLDSIIQKIAEFVKSYGEKAFRYRNNTNQNEKCKFYRFQRINHLEEVILFTSDGHLVLNRFDNDDNIIQKNIRNMNRTIICWYYEGLLRIRRLEEKQKTYLRRSKI